MIWLVVAAAAALLFLFGFTFGCFVFTFVRRAQPWIDDVNAPGNRFLGEHRERIGAGIAFLNQTPYTEMTTRSFDGLRLYARYYDRGGDTLMLLFHGYRSSANRDFSCAVEMYLNLGLNVLLVDQRSHGKSEGRLITYGIKERQDVLTWISAALREHPENRKIFLGGISMGSATVMMSADLKMPEQVKGIVADCGFSSPREIIVKVARENVGLKGPLFMPVIDFYCRLFGGFRLDDATAVRSLQNTTLPVLLIHGEADDFVPIEMSRVNFEAAAGEKELYTVPGAGHGMSYLCDEEGLTRKVREFLAKHS